MSFKTLDRSHLSFKVRQQHLLNKQGFVPQYCILDHKNATPYNFLCPNCKRSSIEIDHLNANPFKPEKIKVDAKSIIALGGAGTISKLIACENCATHYFVGIGYIEPNYGRDVFLMHTIIELETY